MHAHPLNVEREPLFSGTITAKSLAAALGGKPQGDGFMARCPAHRDDRASLSIAEKDGTLLFKCHAGCAQVMVLDALRAKGLWPERGAGNGKAGPVRHIAEAYDYTDAEGTLLFQAVRYAPKGFAQRRPDGKGGWIWNLQGAPLVPYRLPDLLEAIACEKPVFITEGEKDADRLAQLGITATCNSGGAGKWKAEHSAFLKHADVIILPDNDTAGRDHSEHIAASLHNSAARIRVLTLPDLAEKGDVSDWLSAGGTVDELWQLVENAPDWLPNLSQNDWPDPEPIISEADEQPYPVESLPGLLREVIKEVYHYVQAPLPLVASSALSAVSLSCQGLADVQRASNLEGPVSLNLLVIGASGERKSTVDKLFMRPIHQFQENRQSEMAPDQARYRAALAGWEAKHDGYKLAIKEATKKGQPTLEIEVYLEAHENKKPTRPAVPLLFSGDSTMEGMATHMAHTWKSIGLVDAEAGAVFGAHSMGADGIMRFLAFLNKMWDGSSHRHNRRTSEPFTAQGRLTVALLVQPETLAEFFQKNGTLARGIGFFARFLVAHPRSTQGERMFAEPPDYWPALEAFNRRIQSLLNMPLAFDETGKLAPPALPLNAAAKAIWIDNFNRIELALGRGKAFSNIQDVASKAADNIARLAALFHILDHGAAGEIGQGHMLSAAKIVQWHLNEARRFFGLFSAPTELSAAVALDRWLIEQCRTEGVTQLSRRSIQQFGPYGVRRRKDLDEAIAELEELGRIKLRTNGRQKLIEINPQLLVSQEASHAA